MKRNKREREVRNAVPAMQTESFESLNPTGEIEYPKTEKRSFGVSD